MGRSIKKGPYIDHNLEEKVEAMNEGKNKNSLRSRPRRTS